MAQYIVGVDEAGRGPLAGPVAVGAVCLSLDRYRQLLKAPDLSFLKESKQLSGKNRDQWYSWLLKERRRNRLQFTVVLVGPEQIDQLGIAPTLKLAVGRGLYRLSTPTDRPRVLLDGGLTAPVGFSDQQTIIGGDDSEPIIALASIAAKVRRDRKMIQLAKQYPGYDLERHKGYGTASHVRALMQAGLSPIHRRSFCRRWVK